MLDSPADTAGDSPVPLRRDVAPRVTPGDDGLNVRAALAVLRRRRLPLLLCIVLVPLCALLAIRQMTPRYTATGALLYEPSQYKVRELQSILQADPTTEAVMASQAEILQSLKIAQRVAERGNLFANPEFNRSLRPPGLARRALNRLRLILGMEVQEAPDMAKPGPLLAADRNATMVAVQAVLHASPVRFSHVIEVTFTAEDPVVAAAAVNNAMDVYVKDQYAVKHRAVDRATEWLEQRAAELRIEVRQKEDQIAAYRADQRLSQGMHAGTDAEQISHLTEDLVRARADLAGAEARLDAARGKAGAGALAAIAPSVVQLRVQQDQLAGQLQAQQTRLGANHPAADSLRHQLADIDRAVAAETARVVAATESERRAAAERVAALEADLRDAQHEADREGQAQIPLNAIMRDAEASRAQLQAVLERIQQTAQQAALETSEAHEISEALPPGQPSWPRTVPMLAAAGASGVLFGLLLVYLLHLADTTLHSGEDARAATGLPCFALIPEISKRAQGHLRIDDYVIRRPMTAFAEQIRALRAALWLGSKRPRIIAITAARPSEGKTILTIALGRSAQLSGERVIAVECDLRQPSFDRRLQSEGSDGLAELLKGGVTLEAVIRTDPLTGMDYLPSGRPTADVLQLFMSEAMARLLADLRQRYDLVLLDAPPAQAMTEARVVAAVADATLMVVRWRSTPRDVVHLALALLEEAHANVIGCVLSRVDPRAHVRSGYADAEVYHRRYKPYYRG
jgi:capsular exopolysaccharide synthesis family protein